MIESIAQVNTVLSQKMERCAPLTDSTTSPDLRPAQAAGEDTMTRPTLTILE